MTRKDFAVVDGTENRNILQSKQTGKKKKLINLYLLLSLLCFIRKIYMGKSYVLKFYSFAIN